MTMDSDDRAIARTAAKALRALADALDRGDVAVTSYSRRPNLRPEYIRPHGFIGMTKLGPSVFTVETAHALCGSIAVNRLEFVGDDS